MTVYNSMSLNRLPVFIRNVTENIKVTTANYESRVLSRKFIDGVETSTDTKRTHGAIRNLQDFLTGADNQKFNVLLLRSISDGVNISLHSRHLGAFFSGLRVFAGNMAETRHKAEYYRFTADSVHAAGVVFRGLLLFVKIITGAFVRDYLLSRFLKARQELVLKSAISREIYLDSRID
jgi:hypothetical protein